MSLVFEFSVLSLVFETSFPQPAITCSKLTIKTLEQSVK